ncbi:hypothetical protein [Vibrio toranzoniae]|uniref:hypothetical protein n=1 Tax=Vibrio toranzoniae TaxID=1194427 RepID=UPI001377FE26|nr:hypothetical protein [Vibrio toranzoniae]NAZ71960.1 hypothetical protein [Vibrio toranzoniae]
MSALNYKELYNEEKIELDDGVSKNLFTAKKWLFQEYNTTNSTPSEYVLTWKKEYEDIPIYRDLKARSALLLYGASEITSTSKTRKKKVTISSIKQCQQLVNHIIATWEPLPDSLVALTHPIFFEEIKGYLRSKRYSPRTLETHLTSYTTLSDANDFLSEQMFIRFPFDNRNALAEELASEEKGSHPTIIPELYGQILGRLIELVDWYHLQLSGSDEIQYGEMDSPLDCTEFHRVAIGLGYTTCMAFSGMRISEASFLHGKSYETVDFEGVTTSLLNSSTVKLEQGAVRNDVWVCARICEKAIELIDMANLGDWQHLPSNHSKALIENNKSNLNSCLTEFKEWHLRFEYKKEWDASYNLLNSSVSAKSDPRRVDDDGKLYWHLVNHTWRRSFAHFAVGNDLSCLGSLKQQLKHVFIGMTLIYTSASDVLALMQLKAEPKLMKELEKSKKTYNEKYLDNVVNGEASGGFADKFMTEGEPRVFTDSEMSTLEKNNHTASRSTGFGRCFGVENCSVSHVFQPSSCVENNCENLSITKEEAQRWKVMHYACVKNIKKMLNNSTINRNTMGRELSDLRAAEHVMRLHNLEFTEFVLTPP